jgi:hypothetical protein
MALQQDYIVEQIYENARRVKHQRSARVYNFECPICNEGKSRGRKRRGFYIPAQNTICCHNCDWKSNPENWIMEITGKTYWEIKKEDAGFFSEAASIIKQVDFEETEKHSFQTLPEDSINLYSEAEVNYYKKEKALNDAVKYCKSRRLYTAVNKPKNLYFSLRDKIYGNAICFPFYDRNNDINFFQVRDMQTTNGNKYRGKFNAEKTIFNINQVEDDYFYIFIFEGPIDSMFVRNGISIAGTSLTTKQEEILNQFPFHKKIWCLDNQYVDATSREKTKKLLDAEENVFIWPKKYSSFKDINELCCKYNLDKIGTEIIIQNTANSKLSALALGHSF